MAENKKSFVLYADLINVVRKLPNEKKGELFMLILEYVNDLNPITEDILLDVAFEPIKLQLKRDLKNWESIKEKRSQAGKKGGRPKKQTEAKKANAFFEKQNKAKKAVTVNVNDNVNVINNNKAFVADADADFRHYKTYLFNYIQSVAIRRTQLLNNCKIDLELRTELWEDFIKNATVNTPRIEDDKHAWNTFKKFVQDNAKKYQQQKKSDFKGFD